MSCYFISCSFMSCHLVRHVHIQHFQRPQCSLWGLLIERSRVRLPAGTPSGNNSWQVANTHVPLSPGDRGTWVLATCPVTKQYNLVPAKWRWFCGGESNRRSCVALAMRHRLWWFIHLRAQWKLKTRWAYTVAWPTFTYGWYSDNPLCCCKRPEFIWDLAFTRSFTVAYNAYHCRQIRLSLLNYLHSPDGSTAS